MFKNTKAFSSFSVRDLNEAKAFYSETLGVEVKQTDMGLELHPAGGAMIFVYAKPNHAPATFTILNFVVPDIDQTVDELTTRGIRFEQYEGDMKTDAKGIARGSVQNHGPDIAWFKDPAGNFISVIADWER